MGRVNEGDGEDQFPNQGELYMRSQRNALNGKKGQALLKETEAALLAMPVKRLIDRRFCKGGEVCVLGAVALRRAELAGKDVQIEKNRLEAESAAWEDEDDENYGCSNEGVEFAQKEIGCTKMFAEAIIWVNDEHYAETPEQRYENVLHWVQARIRK